MGFHLLHRMLHMPKTVIIKKLFSNCMIFSSPIIFIPLGNPGSNSSTSSETSNSSQQNNGWSFEEQFKQVRQVSWSLCSLAASYFCACVYDTPDLFSLLVMNLFFFWCDKIHEH